MGALQLDCFALGFTLAKLYDLQQKPPMVNPEQLMTQALALASDSLLLTWPNPRVGWDSPQVGDESKALQAYQAALRAARPPTRKPS